MSKSLPTLVLSYHFFQYTFSFLLQLFFFWNSSDSDWSFWWYPIDHTGFLYSVLFFFICSSEFALFQSSYPLTHWFFLLHDLFCCWCSVLHSSFHSLTSSAPKFLFGYFLMISIFVKFLILFMLFSWYCWIVFQCFLIAHWIFPKSFFEFFMGKSQISVSLALVTGGILWFSCDGMGPWFFMFLGALCFCFHIWNSSHLPQSLLAAFRWEILFLVLLYILGLPLALYEYVGSILLFLSCGKILKLVCFL